MRYILVLFAILFSSIQAEELVYQSVKEKKVTDSTWTVDKKTSVATIVGKTGEEITKIECTDKEGYLLFAEYASDQKETLKITRENGKLIAAKPDSHKEYHVGNTPWIQDFAFGLWNFLESADHSYKFCIINPYNLDMHKMVATKQESKTVTVNNTEYEIRVVKVTLQGFQKNMWKAELWYNVKTNDLVRYRANEGPFTPITTISLMSKKP